MKKIVNIALCDDEESIHNIVGDMLEKYSKERECEIKLTHFFSAKELLVSKEEIQILLLDIDLPQMDGIEAAKHLLEDGRICKIIMLTGKQERFKEAFKIGAYRFVTKPIDWNELCEALDDTRKTLLGYEEIELKFNSILCKVQQRNIEYIEACGDYVKIYVRNKVYESHKSLKNWEEELDSRLFVECHKSYIVNLNNIKEIRKNTLVLENAREIPIARRRKSEVLQRFIEYDTK